MTVTTYAPVSGVDFAFYIDTTPPVSAFSFVSGSTLTALATIQGTASDDTATIGPLLMAAQDLDTGLWWNASGQDWVVSTGPIYKLISSDGLPGPLNNHQWFVQARAGSSLVNDNSFGGFSDFLPYGHSFAFHEKQIDIAGNEQLVPAISSFVWRGANGAFGPPNAVGDLSVFNVSFTSVSLNWTAPGEHQNIGQALAYDVRYTTAANVDFYTAFSSYAAAVGLPEPPPAYQNSSFTLTGLQPGKRYRLALKTVNHEGGVSALSNVRQFDTLASFLPPRTDLVAGPPSYSTSTLFVTNASTLGLVAVDDLVSVGDGVGEGVAETYFAVDGGTFSIYTGTFSLVDEGEHLVAFFSSDTRGNVESTRTATVAVDLTAPIASLAVAGSTTDAQGAWIITSTATITLSADDAPSAGVASGVRSILYVIDADPFSPPCESVPLSTSAPNGTCANKLYAGAFTLSAGTHTVYFRAEDNVANLGELHSSSFTVSAPPDALPPRTTLIVGAPQLSTSTVYISSVTPLSLTASDDHVAADDGLGSVSQTFIAIDSASFSAYAGTFTVVEQGTHTIQFYSMDAAGNTEAVHVSTLTVDIAPPVTTLQVGGLTASATSLVLISTDSIGMSAMDADAGVGETRYALDGGGPNVYASTFSLAVGTYTLAYQSVDYLGNTEVPTSVFLAVLAVDTASPTITLTPADLSTVTTASPLIVAVYSDSGRGVNPASVRLILDGIDVTTSAAVTLSSAAITPNLSQGTHTVTVEVADLAGNPAFASSTFTVDSLPPVTTLEIGTPQFVSSATFVTTATPFGFTATKPGETFYAVDGGTFAVYTGTFALTSDGVHTLQFFSLDSFGHQESARTAGATVDSSAPVTQISIGGTPYSSTATAFATVGASFTLAALDYPAGAGLASGVGGIRFLLDAAPDSCPQGIFGVPNGASPAGTCDNAVYSGEFTVSVGSHSIYFASVDNLGNREQVQFITVHVSSFGAPQALANLDQAKRFQEWVNARQALLGLNSDSLTALRAYVADSAKDGRKRFIALEAVVNILPPADGATELINGFQDSDPFFRSPVAMKMGQIGHVSFQPVLLASLNNSQEDGMVQVSAAAGLAMMGDATGKPRALQAVTTAEPWSEFGMVALASLNATDTLSSLQSIMQSSANNHIRNKCRLAILRINLVGKTQTEQLPILQQALQESGFSDVHAWAAMRLETFGNSGAGQALAAVVNSSAPGREEASRWLSAGIGDGYWSQNDIAQWLNN
ncbi:MAG: fibronectin type III domain-containing protein [Elusimicrobia bacterium]|nr:fibronectin type III domain-containing protein [Elusimicrobiota bacterium]